MLLTNEAANNNDLPSDDGERGAANGREQSRGRRTVAWTAPRRVRLRKGSEEVLVLNDRGQRAQTGASRYHGDNAQHDARTGRLVEDHDDDDRAG